MNKQHTPGPWVWVVNEKDRKDGLVQKELIKEGADWVLWHGADWAIEEKDIELIAAAPDLLEALEDVMEWFKKLKDWSGVGDPNLKKYTKAINKARGENKLG